MVDRRTDGGFAWAMLMYELEDAQDAMKTLLESAAEDPEYGEENFKIDMAHIYRHLNRAWHCRNATEEQHNDENLWNQWAHFPANLDPLNSSGS